jgi:RNA polymerase sporulation-specific sigma factor
MFNQDEELIELVHENSEEAKSVLFNKYKDKIDYLIRKYTPVAKTLGIDIKDLNQEALLGFTDAILNYDSSKDASVATFICLCVERKIKKACLKAGTIKNKTMKDSLSLEYMYEDINLPLKELIEDVDSDPLIKVSQDEEYEELLRSIRETLTDNEREVFELLIAGLNYKDIAVILDKEPKQIDNARERIKTKIKKILEVR